MVARPVLPDRPAYDHHHVGAYPAWLREHRPPTLVGDSPDRTAA
ncbi:hypothetical protein [Saccharothrix syringae]|nr:hypothetical protein [Saccharothrix syringae]